MFNISHTNLKLFHLTKIISAVILASIYTSSLVANITVVGIGKQEIAPNVANFSAIIETKAQTANEAAALNATQTDKTLKLLKSLLDNPKAVSTQGYSVYPEYKYNQQTGKSVFDGFKVNNTIMVKTYAIKDIGNLLDNTIKSGVTRVDNLNFSYDKPEEIYQLALKSAVDNAKQRADVLAKASDMQVVKISEITVAKFEFTPSPRPMMARMAMAETAVTTPINAPDVSSEAVIEVVFETE